MAKVILRQTRPSHMSDNYTSQLYQKSKSRLGYKGIPKAISNNLITKLETKFAESEKTMRSRENKLLSNVGNQSS